MFPITRSTKGYGFFMDDDLFLGVCLGTTDTRQTIEWEMKYLNRAFGLDEVDPHKYMGVHRYLIRRLPSMVFMHGDKYTCMGLFTPQHEGGWPHPELKLFKSSQTAQSFLKSAPHETFACAWGGGEFAIITDDEEGRYRLRELHQAFQRRDVAIFRSENGPFGSSGPIMVISSKVPNRYKKAMRETHEAEFLEGK